MKIKKVLRILLLMIVSLTLVSCVTDKGPTDTEPEIHGAVDQTIDKGTKFVPLAGVTATDKEDGDLTSEIKVETNVNYNVVGVYTVTYTVYDKDGNKASVTITVTVVENDKDVPIISGVADKEIIVGEEFNIMDNVSATDVIDGALTDKIKVTGTVNVWVPGKYELTYTVTDKANNTAKATRIISVTLGYFEFKDNVLENEKFENGTLTATVSSGEIDTRLETFGLLKLSFNANVVESQELKISLAGQETTMSITPEVTEYVIYQRYTQELKDVVFTMTTSAELTNISLQFAIAKDTVEPVITVPEGLKIVLPGNITDESILTPFITSKLSAVDNIDGVVTSKLAVNYQGIDLGNFVGDTEVEVYVEDSSGNRGTASVQVTFTNVYDTRLIKNPNFDTDDSSQFTLNGGAGDPVIYVENGELITKTTKNCNPGWDSASSPALRTTTDVLKAGYWYMLKFDAYAEIARKMTIRIGLDTTEANGWIENFAGAANYATPLTTEKTTYYVIFYVHANKSETGKNGIKIEFKLGTFDWDTTKESMNPVHFDNMQFYLLSNDNTSPEISYVEGLPTTFGKGQTLPSFIDYVEAYDLEDGGILTLTEENVDLSKVDINKVGVYPVTITVKDSGGKEVSYTFNITILEEADTIEPVITATPENISVKQNECKNILEVVKVSITDNIDGNISLAKAKIEGKYDLTVVGVYEVTIIVSDTSGNEARKTVTITVTDGEAPVIACDEKIDICIGDKVDITKLIKITDNVDGDISLANASIEGAYDLTTVGTYTIKITVRDAAGNEAVKIIDIEVFPEMGDEITIEDFENYNETAEINLEDGSLYRRWLPYGGEAQTLNDLELVEYNGTKAAQFKYNAGGESILVKIINENLPSKYKYLRFKLETTAEKVRVWFYTEKGNFDIAANKLENINYDENGYFYFPLEEAGVAISDITAVGISMNYQSSGDTVIVDEIGFSTTMPTTTKADFKSDEDDDDVVDLPEGAVNIPLTGNNKDGWADYLFSSNFKTVTLQTIYTSSNKWGRFDFDVASEKYGKVVATLKGTIGLNLLLKLDTTSPVNNKYDSVNGNKQFVEFTEETLTVEWNLTTLGIDSTLLQKLVFWAYDAEAELTEASFKLVSLAYYPVEKIDQPDVPGDNDIVITGVAAGGSMYTFSDDKKTVTITNIPASMNQWARWDFAALSSDVTTVTLTIKTTAGYAIAAKLDGDENPYDSAAGNKQYKSTVDGELTFTWNLSDLNISPEKVIKLVFWVYCKDQSVTTTSFELVNIVLE